MPVVWMHVARRSCLTLFTALAIGAPLLATSARADEGGPAVGSLAPSFLLPVVNDFAGGKRFGPGSWTGSTTKMPKKRVVLSFFATYCEPCKREMPELARLYDTYESQGLGVMLVSIDKGNEQREQVVALAAAAGVHFPVLHDRFQVVARRYSAERLPYLLILDENGRITTAHVGYTDDVRATLEAEIRAGLGLPPSARPAVVEASKSGGKASKPARAVVAKPERTPAQNVRVAPGARP